MSMQSQAVCPIATYRERFAHLRRDFELYDNQIVVSGKIAGNAFETTIPLIQLVPDFGVFWFRGKRFHYGIALFMVLAVFTAMLFNAPPGSPAMFIQIGAGLGAAWGLVWGLSYFPKRPMYRFINEGGMHVLDFIAAGPDHESALEFAEKVSNAIQTCKARRDSASVLGAQQL